MLGKDIVLFLLVMFQVQYCSGVVLVTWRVGLYGCVIGAVGTVHFILFSSASLTSRSHISLSGLTLTSRAHVSIEREISSTYVCTSYLPTYPCTSSLTANSALTHTKYLYPNIIFAWYTIGETFSLLWSIADYYSHCTYGTHIHVVSCKLHRSRAEEVSHHVGDGECDGDDDGDGRQQ